MDLEFHEHAELFPLMTEAELRGLVEDIREHGQRDPIVTLDGKILDGRNRYRACLEIGIEPILEPWDGEGSTQAFVISHNLHRRHLNSSQRGAIAARLAINKFGGDRRSENIKSGIPDLKLKDAAKLLNINKDTITDARLVLAKATEEEIAAVDAGAASVSTIAKQIRKKIPVEERREKIKAPHSQRIQTQQAHGTLWGQLRKALENLSGLPRASDVVRVVNHPTKGKLVNDKLSISIKWLTEFSDAWTSSNAQANLGRKDKPAGKAEEDIAA